MNCSRYALILMMSVAFISGCRKNSQPLDRTVVSNVKNGMTVSEVEALLGPSRAPRSEESQSLERMVQNMPPQMRESASQGTDRAWGNSNGWLVARFSKGDGKLWMMANQFGGPPPAAPPNFQRPEIPSPPGIPQVHFQQLSPK